MAIFRGVGGSGDSSDNSFLQEVTAQANAAEASATSAANSLASIQETEVTSASFDTSDGVLTLTKTGGATVTADLDGRFLTSYTETDPVFSAHVSSGITSTQISNWDTAYGWGNHASAGYLTSETSHDDVLVDGDFASAGFMKTDGGGNYSIDTATYIGNTEGMLVKLLYEANSDTNVFTNADHTKLDGIETSADVTDATNVTSAGAAMLASSPTFTGAITAPNVDISTTGSVTTNIATGNNNDNTTDVKVVNIGTGYGANFFAGLSTTINMGSQSSSAKNIFNIGNGTTSGDGENTINLKGNVTVSGTVDSRDVSVDGAKLDTLERVYRTRFRHRDSETGTFQNLTNTITDIGNPIYTKSTTGSENTLDFFLATTCADYYDNNDGNIEVVVTAPNSSDEDVVNLGTVSNTVSNTPTGQYNFDVVGDVTKHLTDYCGLSVNALGFNAFVYGQVRSNAYYNPSTNKTTISCTQYQSNKPVNGNTVYLHPFDWETSGTAIIGNRIQIDEVVYNAQKMSRKDFSAYLGYFKSSVTVKIRGKEASATTDNIAIRKMEGTLTQVQD